MAKRSWKLGKWFLLEVSYESREERRNRQVSESEKEDEIRRRNHANPGDVRYERQWTRRKVASLTRSDVEADIQNEPNVWREPDRFDLLLTDGTWVQVNPEDHERIMRNDNI